MKLHISRKTIVNTINKICSILFISGGIFCIIVKPYVNPIQYGIMGILLGILAWNTKYSINKNT